jgi:NAD+ kinase
VTYNTIGILFHPRLDAARVLGDSIKRELALRARAVWAEPAWDESGPAHMADTELLVCIGGDGTVLRAARMAIPHRVPIIGVNMGRLGFLSELHADEALPRLRDVLDGAGRIEHRTMLRAEVTLPGGGMAEELGCQHALNDVAVGRSGGRPVDLDVIIDGVEVAVVRADSMVVSTATGSTGYNLSAGGPVLSPEAEGMVLTPVAAHVSRLRPLVLPPSAQIELRIYTELRAVVSFDGQVDYSLTNGATVHVRRDDHVARFIRLGPPSDFFRNLTHLLDGHQRADRREV